MSTNDRMKRRPMTLQLWLSAIDPGLIRLQAAGRAALALLSIWLLLRNGVGLLLGAGGPPIPLYGVLSGIIFLLFIIDLKPSDRRGSLLLAPIPFIGAVLLASLLRNSFWLNNLILLLLFFLAYFFRRYGSRAGELALVGTVGFYIGFLVHPPLTAIPIFAASILVSVAIIFLWEFVLIPYNPTGSLRRGVTAFYHNVALTVASIRQGLERGNSQNTSELHRLRRQVHQNRRIIEGLFAAILSPDAWSQARLTRLQVEMFKAEQGLDLLIDAEAQLNNQSNQLPGDVLKSVKEGLEILEADLWEIASDPDPSRLPDAAERLQEQVKSSLGGQTSAEWAFAVLRTGVAAGQLARSVAGIRAIETGWLESQEGETPSMAPAFPNSKPAGSPGLKSKYAFHPTTILGFQAVLATGLAMLAAFLLKMDQPNLVYWTAFVVIAGSTGESLRRISLRVAGVVAGTVIGVVLAFLLPDNLLLTVLFVTFSIFMMTYSIPTSYIWMVFWLNIAMMLIITTLGGPALDLLIVRPVSTLLGAAIAALIVVFILPIHIQDRFTAALSAFLTEVDRYIEVYVATLMGTSSSTDLKAEELKIDASYKKLELTLPNVAFEYNPLSRAQSRLASQATSLAVLSNYVTHLHDDIGADPGSLANVQNHELLSDLQSEIHRAIDAFNGFLANRQGQEMQSPSAMDELVRREDVLESFLSADTNSTEVVRNRALTHLKRIYDTITQIAAGAGAPAA